MASNSSRTDHAPSLPVPPLLPVPQITSSPAQLTEEDIVGDKGIGGEKKRALLTRTQGLSCMVLDGDA